MGVFGLGAFGRLLARTLAEHADVIAADDRPADAPPGVKVAPPERVATRGVVVLAVNVQHLPRLLSAIAPVLAPKALVADVCSVKVRPVEMMLAGLPGSVEILGTHPLFGPQSVAEHGLAGLTAAVCPARVEPGTLAAARGFLEGPLGLRVVETMPEEHDRQMAFVQALTHLVGHAANEMDLPELELSTIAYRRLLQLKKNVRGDSDELFRAIQRWNPFAAGARETMLDAMRRVHERAGEG